ncbi:MgtC/SapB family protein [Thermoanaerobacterium sp. DL9XJH110]|uniref:MgtC/SapB family protein n=1 Tax=Thermoanaerobacterium sp. DL9XJH110 TaxID=3386643 RepID=UPI003BB6B01E
MPISQVELTLRLLLSILLGGVIGIERESVNRPAGFRTHILVCGGSALTMLVSIYIFEEFRGIASPDPARIAAQVVSGIGFLGAGTIIREGATVRGLTTAASLWTVAAIGLAVGSGFYFAAILATLLTFVTLISFSRIENYIIKKRFLQQISLVIKDRPGQIGKIGSVLGEMNINIRSIKMQNLEDDKLLISLFVRFPSNVAINDVIARLLQIDGIYDIENDL